MVNFFATDKQIVDPAQPEIFSAIADGSSLEGHKLAADSDTFCVRNALGESPLIFASKLGNQTALSNMLAMQADLDAQDFLGFTALMAACDNKHLECVKTLLEAGANPNQANAAGTTALMLACARFSSEIVDSLILRGADINQTDNKAFNAIYYLDNSKHYNLLAYAQKKNISRRIRQDPAFIEAKQKRVAPSQSLAELLGKLEKSILPHFVVYFIVVHFWMVFILGFLPFFLPLFVHYEERESSALYQAFIPAFYAIYSLIYVKGAYLTIRCQTRVNSRFRETLTSVKSFSDTGYIQSLMDFQFNQLTTQFRQISDPQITFYAKLMLAIPVLLTILAVINISIWSRHIDGALWQVAFISLVLSLLGAYIESQRRQFALKRIHQKLDQAAKKLLPAEQSSSSTTDTDFILYLRAFETTGAIKIGETDFESAITRFLAPRILVVTFGVPGEYEGAARVQSTEKKWQSDVVELMHKATQILMMPSDRPGTLWEAKKLKQASLLHKTTFVMPPEIPFAKEKYSSVWERAYTAFNQIGLHIPKHTYKGLIFKLNALGYLQTFSVLQEADLFVNQYFAQAAGADGGGEEGDGGDGGGDGG